MSRVLTADEIIATINRSSIINVLIEGKDDTFVYRYILEKIDNFQVGLIPCNGRTTLLKVFERREEFSDKKTIFIADKDLWIFSSIPEKYNEILFTKGYSIENDIYSGYNLEDLLDEEEKNTHKTLIKSLSKWFAFEVNDYINGNYSSLNIKSHINVVTPDTTICSKFIARRGYTEPPEELFKLVHTEYKEKLRGKQLMQALARILSKKGRQSKFDTNNLMEIGLKNTNNSVIKEKIECLNQLTII